MAELSKPIIEKNSFGFYSVVNKPSEPELAEYYNSKYYQQAKGSYEHSYTAEEVNYFNNKISEKLSVVSRFRKLGSGSRVIDVGCGEGWVLAYCKERGIDCTGLDYSLYGCEKCNPDCVGNMLDGDIYKNITTLLAQGERYDLVWLDNVLEHVIDPLHLIQQCHDLLTPGGVLMVEVPNDYSVIQNYLLENGHVDRPFWIAYPDHLSYFNKEGLDNLVKAANLLPVFSMGDFPIDINLINPNTNYVMSRDKGKSCHQARYRLENLIHGVSPEKAINLYQALMDLGLGRCIISFFVKK